MDEGPNIATPSPNPRRLRYALRLIGWNALLLVAVLALIGLAGEAWRRSTIPFVSSHAPTVFVPDVGFLRPPHTEFRWTNGVDFWTVSRTNRLGFLDRELPSPERAAESCHITMIGDSVVEGREVPISEKFHVRLEEMAALELPALDVTTSAFAKSGTGQINQLAFYDEYARPLRPKLVVLVFVPNDYMNNFPLWVSSWRGWDPEHQPYVSAVRAEDGSFRLRPPDPDYERFRFGPPRLSGTPEWKMLVKQALRESWFFSWLQTKRRLLARREYKIRVYAERARRKELLSRRPAYAPLLDGWRPVLMESLRMRLENEDTPSLHAPFAERNDPPFVTEAVAFTAFALDEFKKRTERDGAALVILASYGMSRFEGGSARLEKMTAERGIPVIDQGDFIRRQGAELRDARWAHDGHWSPAGHQWAAEALLEYLKRNRDVCE